MSFWREKYTCRLHLLVLSRCQFDEQNNHASEITSTHFTWKMGRCHFGRLNNHADKFTSTQNEYLNVILVGKINMQPKLHLLVLLGKRVDVILAGNIKNGENFFQCMKSEELMMGKYSEIAGRYLELVGTSFTMRKTKF
jgi:hypothetical protein